MRVKFHRRFEKQYKKLPDHLKQKTKQVIRRFMDEPKAVSLKNHALTGRMKDLRSISVTGDLRIVFQEFDDYTLVIFLDIGGHGKVYR